MSMSLHDFHIVLQNSGPSSVRDSNHGQHRMHGNHCQVAHSLQNVVQSMKDIQTSNFFTIFKASASVQQILMQQTLKVKRIEKVEMPQASIPVLLACEASALPFELHPPDIIILSFTVFQRIAHTQHDKGEKKKKWRCRASIPVPLACKASALPFELHPPDFITLSFTVFQ